MSDDQRQSEGSGRDEHGNLWGEAGPPDADAERATKDRDGALFDTMLEGAADDAPPPPGADPAEDDGDRAGGDTIIALKSVSKSFGDLKVLEDLSLEFERGRTTVILGPSGTGKSVLLKHIAGLLKPDRGEVFFDGQRIDNLSESQLVSVRKKIGFLFQMGALFDSMNVEQNICFPLKQHTKMSRREHRDRCDAVLSMVGLEKLQDKMPAALSGGQRKRVALARAIVLEPEVVLYDEPTTGLDPIRADVIDELILSLAERLGITSIVVTHDIGSARKIADRLIMLYDGHAVADGEPDAFFASENDLVQRFVQGKADQEDLERIRGTMPTAARDDAS